MERDHLYSNARENRKIRINQDYELNYWCGRFDCSRDELSEAVNSVGSSAHAVARYLGKRNQPEIRLRKGQFIDFSGVI